MEKKWKSEDETLQMEKIADGKNCE